MRRSLERLAEVNVLNFKLEQQADQSVAFEADSRISLKSEPRLEPATAFDHHDPRRSSSRDSGLQKCVHRCASLCIVVHRTDDVQIIVQSIFPQLKAVHRRPQWPPSTTRSAN